MFDITTVAVAETGVLPLLDAKDAPMLDNNGESLSITLHGPGSPEFARATSRRQNKVVDRLKRKGKADMTADEQRANNAEYYAMLTVSFNGWGYPPAGKATGFELFKAAYADPSIGFILDQVAEFVGDWANFTKTSATS